MPRRRQYQANERPLPTPTIFHPQDAVHLRARKIIARCPDSSNGRWVVVHQSHHELLPAANIYARFLRRLNSPCRMPALLHSRETLGFLGLDAAFADECWARWTGQTEQQRRTMPAPRSFAQAGSSQQEGPAQSGMPAFLAHVQSQMLNLYMSEQNRPVSPEEQRRHVETSDGSNDLPFHPRPVPYKQQLNISGLGDFMQPQQDLTATYCGQYPMEPVNYEVVANFSAGTSPAPLDQTFGLRDQQAGDLFPAADADPSTLQWSSSGDVSGNSSWISNAQVPAGFGAEQHHHHHDNSFGNLFDDNLVDSNLAVGQPDPFDNLFGGNLAAVGQPDLDNFLDQPTPANPPNHRDDAIINAAYEAEASRLWGVSAEAAWSADRLMNDYNLRAVVGLADDMVCWDQALFLAAFAGTFTVDTLMAVVVVPRFKLLLQVKRMSEYRATMWSVRKPFRAAAAAAAKVEDKEEGGEVQEIKALAAAIEAVPRCVDPVVLAGPALQPSASDPAPSLDPMAKVERDLQRCVGRLRRQGVHANDCGRITSMRHSDIKPDWVSKQIHRFIAAKTAREMLEERRMKGVTLSTGDDGRDVVALRAKSKPGKKKSKSETRWDFLQEVCWEGVPIGNLWDVANA